MWTTTEFCSSRPLTRRERRALAEQQLIAQQKRDRNVSILADDTNRPEPLIWCHANLCHTLAPGFSICEPERQSDRVLNWAVQVDTPGFLAGACSFSPTGLRLSHEAQRMMDTPNAGGNSALSEALSFDVLRTTVGARLLRTEMEIRYWLLTQTSITDFSVEIAGNTIGVSVTRACKFRGKLSLADATKLLVKKLGGIIESTKHVITPHKWDRQILHIWVQRASMVDILACAYARLDSSLRANTLVLCTIAEDADWLFFGRKRTAR